MLLIIGSVICTAQYYFWYVSKSWAKLLEEPLRTYSSGKNFNDVNVKLPDIELK